MNREQQINARLNELEDARMDRINRYGVYAEEDAPDDAERREIAAEWTKLVDELNAITLTANR